MLKSGPGRRPRGPHRIIKYLQTVPYIDKNKKRRGAMGVSQPREMS